MQIDISEITKLTHDRNTSIRLVREYQKKYPGRTAVWVVQRVISDLHRDRGAVGKTPLIRTRAGRGQRRATSQASSHKSLSLAALLAISTVSTVSGRLFPGLLESSGQWAMRYANGPIESRVLEQPNQYQQIEQGSIVTIQNSAPEGVRVTLKGLDNQHQYSFDLAACKHCRYYNTPRDMPEQCAETGEPVYTLALPPGRYRATMAYTGTTQTESGEWFLANGWEYCSCYFSLYNDYGDDRR